MNNRILAMLLAFVMLISIVPVNAFAAETHVCKDNLKEERVSNGNGTHNAVCNICGEIEGTYDCKYGTDLVCDYCGYVKEHTCADKDFNHLCDYGCGKVVHKMTKVEAKAPNHGETGNIEYFECGTCSDYFEDEAGTKKIEDKNSVILDKVAHTMVWTITETTHKYDCTGCGYDEVLEAQHTFGTPVSNSNGTHTKTCTVTGCGYAVEEECADTSDCKCDVCFADMEHSYEWVYGLTSHWQKCTKTNCNHETTPVLHTNTYEPNGDGTHKAVCSVCNRVGESDVCTSSDNGCACDGCGALMIDNHQSGLSYIAEDPATCTETGVSAHYKCLNCGNLFVFRTAENKYMPVEASELVINALKHNPGAEWVKTDNGAHWKECQNTGCKEKFEYAEHTPGDFKIYDSNHDMHFQQCSVCYKSMNIGAHDITWSTNEKTHQKICSVCKVAHTNPENHSFINYVDLGNGTHSRECSACGYKEEVAHVDSGNCKCDGCGAQMEHNLSDWQYSTYTHWKGCTVCYSKIGETDHNYTYTCNENGISHKAECKDCKQIRETASCYDKNNDCYCDVCEGMMAHVNTAEKTFSMKYHGYKSPTCTADGNHGYYTCNSCSKTFEKVSDGNYKLYPDYVIPALDHDWGNARVVGATHVWFCQRTGCTATKSESHIDENDDCLCDICGAFAHGQIKHKDSVAATCTEKGSDGYYYYEGCSKKFSDPEGTQQLSILTEYAPLGHDFDGEWIDQEDGTHAQQCQRTGCTAMSEGEEHINQYRTNGSVCYCDLCGGLMHEHELTEVAEDPATCTESGVEVYWYSECNGRTLYFSDSEGKNEIASPVVIPAIGHDLSGWTDMGNGISHERICQRVGCSYKESNLYHTNTDGNCICDVCGAGLPGHSLEDVEYIAPACGKEGQRSAKYCAACDKYYDSFGDEIDIVIPALNHRWPSNWTVNTVDNTYEMFCQRGCGASKVHKHNLVLEDPLSGNIHQWVCECDYTETEMHYDNDGDTDCDVCGHDMANTPVVVQNHSSQTVKVGDKKSADNGLTWWQDFWNNLFPGSVGQNGIRNEDSSSNPSSNEETGKANTITESNSGNGASNATGSSNSGSNNSGSNSNSDSNAVSALESLFEFLSNWISSLWNR